MAGASIPATAAASTDSTTAATTTAPPSLKDFYEGLYHSPIYSQHHRVTCNVGYFGEETHEEPNDTSVNAQASHFHEEHTPNDVYQLELYRELLRLVPGQVLKPHDGHPGSNPSLRILDVGCGAGGGVLKMQTMFPQAELIGVDVSSQAIVRSKENWHGFAKHVPELLSARQNARPPRWINQSCERMSNIRSSSMDIVVAVQCLQEVQKLEDAIHEMERVLKPGGVLLVADFIPSDESRDRVRRELLSKAESPSSPPLDAESNALWTVLDERIVSGNAALACKHNSARMESLVQVYVPEAFRADFETLFFVERSNLYEKLLVGDMGYRFTCLQKNATIYELQDIDDADKSEGSGEDDEDDDYEDDDSEYDEEEIVDDEAPNYYSYKEIFPELEVLKINYDIILEEMQAVLSGAAWPFWPEKHYTEGHSEWRVFPFCYTFPAYDASKTTWVDGTSAMCPRTVEVLRNIPGIRTALFSKLGPKTKLSAHRGWADLSNHILRCHIGLVVPKLENGASCCSMVVGGEPQFHQEREIMVFDDSKLHYAYNDHTDKNRFVLIVDLYRPDYLPRGLAKGGHTNELDEFIENFGLQAFGGTPDDSNDDNGNK